MLISTIYLAVSVVVSLAIFLGLTLLNVPSSPRPVPVPVRTRAWNGSRTSRERKEDLSLL